MRILFLLPFLFFSCVNVKENGKIVFHCSANAAYISYQSPSGSKLVINNFDPSSTHSAVGNEISKGIVSAGSAILTSGIKLP